MYTIILCFHLVLLCLQLITPDLKVSVPRCLCWFYLLSDVSLPCILVWNLLFRSLFVFSKYNYNIITWDLFLYSVQKIHKQLYSMCRIDRRHVKNHMAAKWFWFFYRIKLSKHCVGKGNFYENNFLVAGKRLEILTFTTHLEFATGFACAAIIYCLLSLSNQNNS